MRRRTCVLWLCVALGIAPFVFFEEVGFPGSWVSVSVSVSASASVSAAAKTPGSTLASAQISSGVGVGSAIGSDDAEAARALQSQAAGIGDVPGGRHGTGQGDYRIVINIPAYRLSLFRGDELVKEYPIAVGKAVSPSRIGTCTIVHKAKNPTWFPPDGRPPVPPGPDNPVGSRWMGLSWPGYGIHGTNNPASIGKAVSLGCIRMRDEDARELYDIVPVGTQVEFVYRTIEVQPGDAWPGFLGARITVHGDIYGRGVNTLEGAVAALAAALPQPAPDVDEDALRAIVAAASGKPEFVPWKPRIEVDGCPLSADAVRIDAAGNVLVAVRPVADALKCYVHWDQARRLAIVGGVPVRCVVVSGRAHVPLDELQRIFVAVLINWDPQALTLAISTRPAPSPSPAPAPMPELVPEPPGWAPQPEVAPAEEQDLTAASELGPHDAGTPRVAPDPDLVQADEGEPALIWSEQREPEPGLAAHEDQETHEDDGSQVCRTRTLAVRFLLK
ncbi:MAG: L,D-transpeptidase family protein [Bacillota bacterium]|nr:L,D-transpeptidase family protein [Bacillota bacterium]